MLMKSLIVTLAFVTLGVWAVFARILPVAGELQNVIFIHIDTIRADHLSLYGYSRDTTPNLDKFGQESLVFEQAIAQASWTLPSYASILTSQYPSAHGLVEREECLSSLNSSPEPVEIERKGCLPSSKLTLAEVLNERGYKTAAFVGDGDLKSKFGFSQGFDTYTDNARSPEKSFFSTTVPLAEEWLEQNKKSKFFLYLQGYDVHTPYHKPEPYDHMFDKTYTGVLADHTKFVLDDHGKPGNILLNIEKLDNKPYLVQDDGTKVLLTQRDIDHIIAHYDGGIRYTDNLIQGFFDRLKQLGLYDNSIIVVFGDHGESVGDDLTRKAEQLDVRLVGHVKVYDELVRVPLLIKAPGLKPGRISSQVQLIDLFPTILDFLNIPQNKEIRNEIQGKSLVSVSENKESEQFAYGESHKNVGLSFIRTLKWKLIHQKENGFQLYDLENDPGETRDVAEEHPDVTSSLGKNLFEWSFTNLQKQAE